MKTSRFALAAVAGLALGTVALSPARAADLGGGDCCADLEERVAELEATTARKGNRKVSLEVSGQVNRALLIWDDGIDSDAYVVDNNYSSSRFRFKGEAKIADDWKAGFLIEVETFDSNSQNVSQFDDEGTSSINTRHAAWYIDSKKYGRVTLGQTSAATDDLTKISVANTLDDANLAFGGGFFVRTSDGGTVGVIGNYITAFDETNPNRDDLVRYDTPSIFGFILSASYADDDVGELAVRFKSEWNSIQVAAAVGYQKDMRRGADSPIDTTIDGDRYDGPAGATTGAGYIGGDANFDERLFGVISMMHTPTGLFVTFSAGEEEFGFQEGSDLSSDEGDFFFIQAGIEKNYFGIGKTTVYGHYAEYDNLGGDNNSAFVDGLGNTTSPSRRVLDSFAERYGFGVVQQIDAAAMELYAQFNLYDVEVSDIVVTGATATIREFNTEEYYGVMVGSRIKF